jgi:predicted HTH transcriptional regulator
MEERILEFIRKEESVSSGEIHQSLEDEASLAAIKRHLSNLIEVGYLSISGSGRSTKYHLTIQARLLPSFSFVPSVPNC